MKKKAINTTFKKKIQLHLSVLLSLVLLVSCIQVITTSEEYTYTSFIFFFLQAATGILLFISPPVYLNIYWLIPKFLVTKKYALYFVGISLLIVIWGYFIGYFEPWTDHYWFNQPYEGVSMEKGFLPMIFIIAISTFLHLSYRWFIQQTKIKEIENERLTYELSLLKNQIKPHFFFNTLNNLYALALENSEKTPEVILKLSEMMRYTIYECKEPKVSISKEITYIENYIALQKIRYLEQGNITFTKEIQNSSVQISPMILIVFIENAFKHGFEHMEHNGFITIDLISSEDQLSFKVTNNYDPYERKKGNGLGLENVKRRLTLLYPNQHTLDIHDYDAVYTADLKLNL
ncbi:histidine kinase [Aquimarina sp. D1M17]|uniref:sensor histidine kinase n=1 Tax=Aquimarina acroporae TaxID=2937283 RepID=UPI0020C12315|nr:histidine kinase [Aquimarina acroporae]MCK8520204.1 histidine kinase [Aquimarina acroporae]